MLQCPFYIKLNYLLKFSGIKDYFNSLIVCAYEMLIDMVPW